MLVFYAFWLRFVWFDNTIKAKYLQTQLLKILLSCQNFEQVECLCICVLPFMSFFKQFLCLCYNTQKCGFNFYFGALVIFIKTESRIFLFWFFAFKVKQLKICLVSFDLRGCYFKSQTRWPGYPSSLTLWKSHTEQLPLLIISSSWASYLFDCLIFFYFLIHQVPFKNISQSVTFIHYWH